MSPLPLISRRFVLLVLSVASLSAVRAADWIPLSDGKTLNGWHVPDPQYWSVENGAIVGRITPERPCTKNQYLVWAGGELADFEFKVRVRLRGEGGINNGFQFRSRRLPDHDVCGYQVDNNLQTPWLVRLYDEYGRHTLAMRGQRTTFDASGRADTVALPEAAGDAWFRLEDWHEYHLRCVGTRLTLSVDGRLAAEVVDDDPQRHDLQGVLALQLHSGPPTVVEFKDPALLILKAAEVRPAPRIPPARERLRRDAAAWWDLDTGGHGAQPPLRHHPEWERFELNTLATGPGARAGARVVLLEGAHFDAGRELRVGEGAVTLYLRARDAAGKWDSALVTRADARGPAPFRLSAEPVAGTSGSELKLQMATEGELGSVRVALTKEESGRWLDLVGRYDGRELVLFVNGEARARAPLTGGLRAGDAALLMGAEAGPGGAIVRQFHGALEHAGLWSRALTDEEIRALSD